MRSGFTIHGGPYAIGRRADVSQAADDKDQDLFVLRMTFPAPAEGADPNVVYTRRALEQLAGDLREALDRE